ncbi:MAG: NAD(P)/FAD-dependent oxidoreductase [Candidatus Hodarchaeales archaeon]|jgi:thioredoxin reductase
MSITVNEYDVIIVGGGPAGLSAGIVAAYKGLKVAVFEGGTWGGLLSTIYPKKKIHNYPGTQSIRSSYLVSEWVRQAVENGVLLIKERITKISLSNSHDGQQWGVETSTGEIYSSKVIILATGMRPGQLGIPGEAKLSKKDKGVYPYVTDPVLFRDKRVLVVGGGDTAIDAVIDLSSVAETIFLAHRRRSFRASETKAEKVLTENLAEILMETTIKEILGARKVEGAILENLRTGEIIKLDVDMIILAVGLVPNNEIFADLGLELHGKFLKTDELQRTNVEGMFAAGDMVSPYQLAVVAASQGALAAHGAYLYIRKPYWKKEHLKGN